MITLQPPSSILMGMPGSGKSYAIATYLKAGIETFILGTEPGFIDTVLDACRAGGISTDRLHWHSLSASTPSWAALEDVAAKVNAMSYESLSLLKDGIGKREMRGWMALLHACKDFPDDRTGQRFGDVTTWDDTRAFVIDSLSGVNDFAREHTAGFKPNLHPGEWGTAMELERNLIRKLVSDRGSYFTLITHLDRSVDEVTQSTTISVAALGNKLGPKLPKDFSEVILAQRPRKPGDPFTWRTIDAQADVKNRALPIADALPADFGQIVRVHEARKAALKGGTS